MSADDILPVSVIIASFNRGHLVERFLPSYLRQRCAEIIIIDDELNNPVSLEAVERLQAGAGGCALRVIRNKRPMGVQYNRRVGVEQSTQPFIYIGQDDSYVADGHIRNLYDYVRGGSADLAATTWVHTPELDGQTLEDRDYGLREVDSVEQLLSYFTFYFYGHTKPTRPIEVPWITDIGLMRREIAEGGYDPGYRGNGYRVETDFQLNALSRGARMAFIPGPPAFHYKGELNSCGGIYDKKRLRQLVWYEFWVAVNTVRFLRKQRRTLKSLGCPVHPWAHTGILMVTRVKEWPARWRGR
jgi:glycosyltransferase involved in cell wall biosynthesis